MLSIFPHNLYLISLSQKFVLSDPQGWVGSLGNRGRDFFVSTSSALTSLESGGKICPSCGFTNSYLARNLCERCGVPLTSTRLQATERREMTGTEEVAYCYYCGATMPTDPVFCRKCGKTQTVSKS